MTQLQKKRMIEGVGLLLILGMGAYFRLANIHGNPGWFTDEGTHLEIARSLLDGRIQYLAISQSVLLFSRLPLFGWLLAGTGRLFGLDITTLRLLTGVLGILSVGLLAMLVRRMTGEKWLAYLAAFVLAVFPAAVVYNRFGFSYNLLTPLLLLACLGLWEFEQTGSNKWLALAALSMGLGLISELWMISYLPVFVIIVAKVRRRALVWSLPLLLLPIGLYVLVSLLTTADAFLFDLNFVRSRLSLPAVLQLQSLATNLTVLVSQDGWIALGFVGLLALPRLEQRRFLLLFVLLPLLILGRSTALHGLGFHYMIPLLPFIALGLAALLHRGLPILAAALPFISETKVAQPAALILLALPFLTTIGLLFEQVDGRFNTVIDPFLVNSQEAEAAATFINQQLNEGDLVIATPAITWLLHTKRADFQMSIAANGVATPHIPADIPIDRYAFNPDYREAQMVVMDNWWQTWGQFNVPGMTEMIAEVSQWPLLFTAGQINVYGNPDRP
jgi:4-amino-4-deoxy-L-arabinose transferase-like glycosyltransferase